MNKLHIVVLFLGLFIFLDYSFAQTIKQKNRWKDQEQDVDAKSDPDDPQARERYELMRLRDPATGQIPSDIRRKELQYSTTLPTRESLLRLQKNDESVQQVQATTWNPRGPYNVGGRTRALGIDISNENILLAGGVSGGMWRSVNGGTSWTSVTNASSLHSVSCLTQDKRTGQTATWYYGTGEIDGNSASETGASFRGDGIFKSTDNGLTWTLLSSTSTGTPQSFDQMFDYIWNVAADSSNPSQDVVYAATVGGIKRSTNGGTTWATVLGGFTNSSPFFTDVAVTSSGVVYATMSQYSINGSTSTTRGIFRSPDGVTWTNITPGSWPAAYNRIVLGIAPSSQNNVYVFGETPSGGTLGHSLWKYTYLSGDGSGANGTWINRSANIPAFGGNVGNYDSQGSYDMYIKVKPDNDSTVFLGGTNLYRSTNGFNSGGATSWIAGYSTLNDVSLYPNHHPDQHSLVFSPTAPATMFTGDDGGVQKTTNNLANNPTFPVTWTSLDNGYTTSQFYTVAIDHATSGNNVVIGGLQDNNTWFTNNTVQTNSWVSVDGGDGGYAAVADGRTNYYTSSQGAWISRQQLDANGNVTGWVRVDPTGGSGYLFIDPFVLDPNNTNMMYLTGGSVVWRNSNLTAIPLNFTQTTKSTNWTQLTNSSVSPATITALGISKSPANILYYGTDDGRVLRINNAQTGNPSPANVTGVNFPAGANVSCLAVDPTNANNVIAVFSNYNVVSLFSTTDGGTSWSAVCRKP